MSPDQCKKQTEAVRVHIDNLSDMFQITGIEPGNAILPVMEWLISICVVTQGLGLKVTDHEFVEAFRKMFLTAHTLTQTPTSILSSEQLKVLN